MKDITILMTAAGSPSGPAVASCFRNLEERNIRIIGTDMKSDSTIEQYVDKCYYAPAVVDPNYIDCLLEICKKENVDVIFPGISDELLPLCNRKAEFEAIGTKVSVSNARSIEVCTNKRMFYDFLAESGIKTPEYRKVTTLEEFDTAVRELGYPEKKVCMKAVVSSGSRGVRIIDATRSRAEILFGEKPNSLFTTYEDLRSILAEVDSFPEMMAMEYIPGREYSIDLVADNGKVLYICGRNSDVVNASIPMEGSLCKDEEAYALCEKIASLLKIDGNADFDFKYDAEGHAVLMEINPRQAATMAVFRAGGVNLLYLRVKQLLGEELPKCEIKYGTRFKRRYGELYADIENNPVRF
jgi:carbamoyl-phosphate synthase large subunit